MTSLNDRVNKLESAVGGHEQRGGRIITVFGGSCSPVDMATFLERQKVAVTDRDVISHVVAFGRTADDYPLTLGNIGPWSWSREFVAKSIVSTAVTHRISDPVRAFTITPKDQLWIDELFAGLGTAA